jgi:hypothetical protein
MVKAVDKNGDIAEIGCDICHIIYDDPDEIKEFMRFCYTPGTISEYNGMLIEFDVCMDCFEAAFPEIFE